MLTILFPYENNGKRKEVNGRRWREGLKEQNNCSNYRVFNQYKSDNVEELALGENKKIQKNIKKYKKVLAII